MNTSSSLYLIQAHAHNTANVLDQLAELWAEGDQVVMMAESIWCYEHPFLKQLDAVYALDTDLSLLPPSLQSHYQALDYAKFADLCLQFNRCVRLA